MKGAIRRLADRWCVEIHGVTLELIDPTTPRQTETGPSEVRYREVVQANTNLVKEIQRLETELATVRKRKAANTRKQSTTKATQRKKRRA